MTALALNHILFPDRDALELIALADSLGCAGVELRVDGLRGLDDPAQSGRFLTQAREARRAAAERSMRVLALCELRAFNDWTDERAHSARELVELSNACGAEAILLLPRNDGFGHGNGERQASLRLALRELGPMLGEAGLVGLIEPLGFERCSLRSKAEVVNAIESLGERGRFQLVHDTFHHHLAGEGESFAAHTGLVHVSSVVDPSLSLSQMRDADRVLPNARDRLSSLEQISRLRADGYTGSVSVTCFALPDPPEEALQQAVADSIAWLHAALKDTADSSASVATSTGATSRLVTSVT